MSEPDEERSESDVEERDEGGEIKIVRNGRRSGREWLEEILRGTKRGGWCRKDEGGDEGGERKVRMEKTQDREERRGVFNDMCKEVWRDGEMLTCLDQRSGEEIEGEDNDNDNTHRRCVQQSHLALSA